LKQREGPAVLATAGPGEGSGYDTDLLHQLNCQRKQSAQLPKISSAGLQRPPSPEPSTIVVDGTAVAKGGARGLPRPVFVLKLRAEPGADGIRSLRWALKALLRRLKLRCIDLRQIEGRPHED
jgi:hypothetical protein